MSMNQRLLWLGGFCAALTACQPTTQVTFDITTDIPCERLSGVSLTVGITGQTEKADPRLVTRTCKPDGTVGVIGTYAIVPSRNKEALASVKVAAAIGSDIDVATDCTAASQYRGCVVARRQIAFVPRQSLVVPIELYLVCQSVSCDENSTCNRAGRCVSAQVDPGSCDARGVCAGLETKPGTGLPCFNDGATEPLLCTGETRWCTRETDGTRSCQSNPSATGLSFECRSDADCGNPLRCVPGNDQVLGQCVLVDQPGTPSISTVRITDSSPSNHPTLSLAYTGVSGPIAEYCVLENSAVVSACTWVPASEPPTTWAPRLTSGPLFLTVYVRSGAGRTSGGVISNQVVVDRVAPVVTWVSPAGAEQWANNVPVQLQWQASDDRALPPTPIALELSVDDGVTFTGLASGLSNGPWAWTPGVLNSSKVRLKVSITDLAGNVTTATSNRFTVGTPVLTIDSLQVNAGAATTNQPQLALTWGAVSGTFAKYCINANDTQADHCTWVAATSLPSSYAYQGADGAVTLTAWVQAGDGTTSMPVTGNTILVDTTPPTASWLSPLGGELWGDGTQTLSWSASDAQGLAATPITVERSLDNGQTFTLLTGPRANTPSTFAWSTSGLNATQARLRLSVSDTAGNTTRVTTPAFGIDSVTPAIASLTLNGGAAATNTPSLTLTWGAITDSFTSVCVLLNDTDRTHCAWVTAAVLPTSYALTSQDGPKTLTAFVRDAAGNISSAVTSNTVTLDTRPPTVTWLTPVPPITLPVGVATTLSWVATDSSALAALPIAIEYTTNSTMWTQLAGPLSNSPASTTWVPTGLNSTTVQLRITATDAAGNTATATTGTFTVTPVTPTLSSLQVNAGATLTNSTTLTLTWGATNNAFNRYCINVNDTNVNNCTWVNGFTLPATTVIAAGDGFKTLTAWVQNSVGANSTPVTATTFFLDQTPPTGSLTTPATGQLWSANQANTVTWAVADSRALATLPVTLERSLDNGATWSSLATSLAATPALFSWTEPTITTTQAKVRMTVTDQAGNSTVVTSGAFSLTPLQWSPTSKDFGALTIHTISDQQTFTFTNSGIQAVSSCSAPVLSNTTDFHMVVEGCGTATIAPAGTCVVKVRANPRSTGVKSGTVTRACGSAGSIAFSLSATGTGTFPVRFNVATLALGEVLLNRSSSAGELYFQNLGVSDATGCTAVALSNPTDFSIASDGCTASTLAAGDMCTVRVRANPTTIGAKSTTVTRSCTGSAAQSVTVNATGMTATPTQVASTLPVHWARMSDGTVRGWGNSPYASQATTPNPSYTPAPVVGLTNVAAVAGGRLHQCVLLTDQTVKCWGTNYAGEIGDGTLVNPTAPQTVTGLTGVTQLALGASFSCALTGGQVKCWGQNNNGQLGNASNASSSVPVTVSGLSGVTQIAAGEQHVCALLSDQTLRCWGFNGTGNLGCVPYVANSNVPLPVSGVTTAIAVSAGSQSSCAVLQGGTMTCWGNGPQGMLGDGTGTSHNAGPLVSGISTATKVATNVYTTYAVLADQTVKAFGFNNHGQLGDGTCGVSLVPQVVSGVTGVTSVSTNGVSSCALGSQGVWCWGRGTLGDGETNLRLTPHQHPTLSSVASLGTMSSTTCVLLADQSVKCWGLNSYGQIGDGTQINRMTPVSVALGQGALQVGVGDSFGCARLLDGSVRCWGFGGRIGQAIASTSPVVVPGLPPSSDIAVGISHACSVAGDGRVSCWGSNAAGQLGNNSLTTSITPVFAQGLTTARSVTVGYENTCALMADQTVQCWGNQNQGGQLANGTMTDSSVPVPIAGLTQATQLAMSRWWSCALLADGTVACWGDLPTGKTITPVAVPSLSNVTQITSAGGTMCALLSDQTVKCWGQNSTGMLGVGTLTPNNTPQLVPGLTGVTRLMVPNTYSSTMCAIRGPSNAPVCWGDNSWNQAGDLLITPQPVSGW